MKLQFEPTSAALLDDQIMTDEPVADDIETLLKTGISSAQQGDREAAREYLLKAAEADPKCEDAWMWLASISEYPEELLAFLNNVLAIDPAHKKAVAWQTATQNLLARNFVERAVAARDNGLAEAALDALNEAIRHDSRLESAWLLKAELANDEYQKTQFLEQVLLINPNNREAAESLAELSRKELDGLYQKAREAAAAGDLGGASGLLRQAAAAAGGDADSWLLISHLSPTLDEKVEALEMALAADAANPAALKCQELLTTLLSNDGGRAPVADVETADMVEASDLSLFDDAEEHPPESIMELADTSGAEISNDETGDTPFDPFETLVEVEFLNTEPEILSPTPTTEAESDYELTLVSERVESDDDAPRAGTILFAGLNDVIEDRDPPALPRKDELDPPAPQSGEKPAPTVDISNETLAMCPFCFANNDPQAVECSTCHAVLTFSNIETLLANESVDVDLLRQAVARLEGEWNLRDFTVEEMITLSLACINLRHFEDGFRYLREAASREPNNVILASQVNTLAIRLDEMGRQNEAYEMMPRGKTILVVDDSPTVRKLIASKLEKCGHLVICAEDGIEALERIEETLPDLVLLDITMPRMDGYEVCKQIRSKAEARNVPVVMISGKDGFFDKVRGRMAGTTGYVTKPFGPETLMKALEAYLLPDTEAFAPQPGI